MELKNNYIIIVIRKFAEHFALSGKEAYVYLRDHSGIKFLDECYEAEHQLSFEDAVEDVARVCMINGGNLVYA